MLGFRRRSKPWTLAKFAVFAFICYQTYHCQQPQAHIFDWSSFFWGTRDDLSTLPNDGQLHLEHVTGWYGHWSAKTLDDLKDGVSGRRVVNETGVSEDPYEFGPQNGYAKMSATKKRETVAALRKLIEEYPVDWIHDIWHDARNTTLVSLQRLADCIEEDSCFKGETTVIIGGTSHFGNVLSGSNSGENIWARSTMDAVEDLGHTMLYTYEPLEALQVYRAIPHLVPVLLLESVHIQQCAEFGVPRPLTDEDIHESPYGATALDLAETNAVRSRFGFKELTRAEFEADAQPLRTGDVRWGWLNLAGQDMQLGPPFCVKRQAAEDGLPLSKMFSFHFWPGEAHPLGCAWTVSPEDYANHPGGRRHNKHNFYLGYSIERYCKVHRFVPREERKHRAFVYAKQSTYFDKEFFAFWNNDHTFANLKKSLGIDFLAASGSERAVLADQGLTNIGPQPMDRFYEEVASSKLMVGTGSPGLSPTPYDGLCLGLPFINPINDFDRAQPDDREQWNCQHNGLWNESPPYVYTVHRDDLKGLEEAIRQAKDNPIDGYTPPHMTIHSNMLRHKTLVNMDWRRLAHERHRELQSTTQPEYMRLVLV